MRRLMVVIFLLAIGIAILGFYQGWFRLSSNSMDHESSATITVDKDKFQKDEEKAKERVQDFGKKTMEKTGDRTDKVNEQERKQ
jgi:hypothetical protein